MSETLVKLEVAQGRRMFGVIAVIGLGLTLLYICALYPPSRVIALILLTILGFVFVWAGYRLFQSTKDAIILTREGISTESGKLLCDINDITSVDRGFFAFKPSNGFLIRLKSAGNRSWAPGMWWHLGKRIGIGGVTSPRQSKEMVSILQILLAERDAPTPSD